jgi:hypothetical protein
MESVKFKMSTNAEEIKFGVLFIIDAFAFQDIHWAPMGALLTVMQMKN